VNIKPNQPTPARELKKFSDPDRTAKGEVRASVRLNKLETLWFNTGTLCNIACTHCYIESTPKNDRLEYITAPEVAAFLDEIGSDNLGTREIGFTGGEPFMNPDMITMTEDALSRGFNVLILSNAMQPMQRKKIKSELIRLNELYHDRLTLRVSLDHFTKKLHEEERGAKTWDIAIRGINWLAENGFKTAIAGRSIWGEDLEQAGQGYAHLIATHNWPINPASPNELVVFPEMDLNADVPEITTACWGILNVDPDDIMCAKSRMIVKRKGADAPTVIPCTLIPYDEEFEMGQSLNEAASTSGKMFDKGSVKLCHPHCAKFCVLGGGSCS